jgi:GNAT superfamily N-acetyltransferase
MSTAEAASWQGDPAYDRASAPIQEVEMAATAERNPQEPGTPVELAVRPLREDDLETADRVMRIAFGTYLKLPDPIQVFGDADYVRTRFAAAPDSAFAAELDGEVVGSNFATRWGSFAFFGPLTVRVDLWDRGIASRLMEPVLDLFERWGVRHAGLFTWPESPKHIALYNKLGFWPQQLNPVLATEISTPAVPVAYETFSAAREKGSEDDLLEQCREVAGAIYEGLDLQREIVATDRQGLGDTVLLAEGDRLAGFAVCHCGAGTEAGSGACFVKFGAVLPGEGANARFEQLVDACEDLAAGRGLSRLMAGVNTARHGAYRTLLGRGYRAMINGLTMLRPNEPAYNRPDVYVIDDLR